MGDVISFFASGVTDEERKCGGEYGGGTKKRRRPGGDAASLLGMSEYYHSGYVGIKDLSMGTKG